MSGQKTFIGTAPNGYTTVAPYLFVHRAEELIGFLTNTFEGKETAKYKNPDGSISHAEVKIGDTVVMIREATSSYAAAPCNINLYVSDVDSVYSKALKNGASSVMEPADQLHGERTGTVKDNSGNRWWISTRIENLTSDEIKKRVEEARKNKK